MIIFCIVVASRLLLVQQIMQVQAGTRGQKLKEVLLPILFWPFFCNELDHAFT